jgi:hypothetical protein
VKVDLQIVNSTPHDYFNTLVIISHLRPTLPIGPRSKLAQKSYLQKKPKPALRSSRPSYRRSAG